MSKFKSTIFKWISNQVGLHPGHPGYPGPMKNPVAASNPIRGPWNSPSCSRWKGRRSVPWASSRCWCDLPDRFQKKKMEASNIHPESVTEVMDIYIDLSQIYILCTNIDIWWLIWKTIFIEIESIVRAVLIEVNYLSKPYIGGSQMS